MKKGEISNQFFLYIFTLIVIGMLLVLGVKWIIGLWHQANYVDWNKFKADFEDSFDGIRPNSQSSKSFEINVPGGVDMVCLIDRHLIPSTQGVCDPSSDYYNSMICNSWRDNVSSISFYGASPVEINIGQVFVDTPTHDICFDLSRNRRISFKMQGLGDSVRVFTT
jgi:hypothetical protein